MLRVNARIETQGDRTRGEERLNMGETTRWGSVRKSKKIQMYSDRFKSLVEYCDDVYTCDVCGGMLCVMNIYIYRVM